MAEAYSAFRITAAEERSDLGNILRLHARADSLRPAVVHADETLSYGELERRTAALAWRLREHQAGPERVVAVHAKDRLSGLIAMVSVLRAGAVYLALEPGAPAARQKLVLEDSGAVLVLGDDESFDEPPTMRITGAGDDHGALLTPDAAHTAYLVYTSGTTGRPKPVAVPYGALHEHLSGLRTAFGLGPGDRVLHFAPPHVDVAIEQALAPLSAGATLVLTPGTSLPSIPDLVGLLHRERVTVANLPAGYLSELAGTLPRHPLPAGHSLRLMISGSDRMPSTAARAWLRHAPGVRLVNAYGPTESVITAATHEVTQAHGDIPIGAACGDRVLHVLDSSLSPCPAGEQGELYISGPLAHGYLGRPVPTARQFVPDPYGAPGARLYRTGDLARRREDGLLEFVGRIDDQLKIRGFRVEPAETRRVLEAHPDVRQCAVLGRRNGAGDTRLIGYVVSETGTGELMRFLTERLPRPLVPAHLIRMDRLPLTAGGTLDRDALPAAEQNPSRTEPPRTATEELLAGLWLETLGRDHIGRHDNFFALGGDSLTALRITARLLRYFGRDLTPQAVFETPVLADLAARLDAGQSAKPAGAAPRNGGDEGPLSLGQQALWLSEQWNPEAPIYNLPWLFRLSGPVDAALLERALNRLIERHEALRTVFPSRLGEPRQVVLPSVSVPVEKGEGLEEADVREPFDLDHGPLIRARLLRAVDGGPALLVVVHHLVWDEWSLGLFETELGELYQALSEDREPRLPALTARPIDYAADRREADHEQGLAYWRDRLADLPATAGEDRSPAGAVVRFALPPQLVARVRALARDAGATPFMVLLAAFAQMVQRRTGQDDLLVATPTADRDQAEWEGLIGYFVNLVPLRIKVSTDFRELLSRVREDVLTDLAHRDVPFPLIAEHVPRASGVALAFEMHRHRPCPLRLGEAEGSRELLPTGAAKFDMIWQITDDGERLFGVVEFSTDLYDTAEVETMVADWESGLTGAVQPLAHEVFEWRVGVCPDAVAVVEPDGVSLTYRQLNARANQLARELGRRGIGRGSLVGLRLRHSATEVVAILAVIKAGAAYVPLEPGLPEQRLIHMATDSGARLILTTTGHDWTHTDTPVLNLDQLDTGHHDDTNPNLPINPDDPFYLPYTSGSTGTPKATLVPHRAIPGFFLGAGYASWTPHTTALLHSALSWDLHLLEILPPLTAGSRLIIHTDPDTNPLTVAHTAHATHVTTLFLSTASFNTVITTQPHLLTNIYHLIFGGETAIPTHVATALATLPHTHLYNAYGPVETTVWAMIHPITPDDLDQPGIPLGRPLGDRRIQLLNPDLTPTPPGQIGHLHISGPGLAHGYLNQPATTARHFTPDPTGPPGSRRYATGDLAQHTPDRRLIFHGRNDTQHKIRGYRVELAEIESRLLTHPNVAQVAVTTHPDPTGTLRLNAYLTTHGDRPTPDQLRNHLKPHLPDYMIPTGYHYLDALPTTHNGKINRKALQPPQLDAPPRQPAATPLHHTLTQIWSRSLGFASLAVDADLFELGAHSFTVAKAKARIAVAFQIDLPLRVFYTARTIDDQAEALMERAPSRPTLLRRAEEIAPLSELDDQAWVAAVARVPS